MQATLTANELQANLAHFSGSCEAFAHHSRRIRFTEGLAYLAEKAGAYWLIDAIASYQGPRLDAKAAGFQVWTLTVTDGKAVLECRADTNAPALVRQEIEYTDFPLASMKLYVQGEAGYRMLMLPGEY
jgi:hypothetical protein